jgi:hypothetical protein
MNLVPTTLSAEAVLESLSRVVHPHFGIELNRETVLIPMAYAPDDTSEAEKNAEFSSRSLPTLAQPEPLIKTRGGSQISG